MNRHLLRAAAALLMMCSAQWGVTARAAVIYNNGGSPVQAGFYSDPNQNQLFADNFTLLPGQSTITDVHWTGAYGFDGNSPGTDSFTIEFFLDDGSGAPQLLPFLSLPIGGAGRLDTGAAMFNLDLYSYSANIAPLALLPNTPYWLSIVNDTTADADDDWLWGYRFASPSDQAFFRSAPGIAWNPTDGQLMDFQLTNDGVRVPEPASFALVLISLAIVAVMRRRKRA